VLLSIWDTISPVAPFAFRVLDEIAAYLNEASKLNVPWQESLDEQLLQKLLPKLKGADPQVGHALERLRALAADGYPLTRAKVTAMLERAKLHGFASFY
jgi:hypothetical protein